MFYNVTIRNIETGKVLDTDNDGVYALISFNADGSIELEELGLRVDNSTRLDQDTKETYLDVTDYEVIELKVYKI